MHKGEPKTWYIIPEEEKEKFEEVIKEKYEDIFKKRPNIMNHIILQMNPLEIMKKNVKQKKTHIKNKSNKNVYKNEKHLNKILQKL